MRKMNIMVGRSSSLIFTVRLFMRVEESIIIKFTYVTID